MTFLTKSLAAGAALIALAGTIVFAMPKADAGTPPPPPPLADDALYLTNTVTVTLPGTIPQVRAFFDANPITEFVPSTDAIPAITGLEVLSGTWAQVGAVRRVNLDGGFSVVERILTNQPDHFSYQIWSVTAPAGRFIDHIRGQFTYTQLEGSVEVQWDYSIKPRVFFARPFIQRYLTNDFAPFMKIGMAGLSDAYQNQ